MTRRALLPCVVALAAAAAGCADTAGRAREAQAAAPVFREQHQHARRTLARMQRQHLTWPEERAMFDDAARVAWRFADRQYQPSTGFMIPLVGYPFATVWDLGSMLAALYSARELGLLEDGDYARRVSTMLASLQRLPLYNNRVFNKAYDVRTGRMVTRGSGVPAAWTGWSTTDLGRLLIWLKIVAADPRFRDAAAAVVTRNDLAAIVRAGYLWGEDLDERGRPREYQEGSIGYEQYAARGFALWGFHARRALNLTENALPINVLGHRLYADFRRWDRLTSEPFLLWGLELGWEPEVEAFVRNLQLAQEARYRKTGEITIMGEDAMVEPPHFFYYYCLYADGKEFAIDVQDRGAVADGPRWLSAKSAFAFHALMPTAYTERAVAAAAGARSERGWGSGVYESTHRSTGSINVNTAAVILTAALVYRSGVPLLEQAQRSSGE